MHDSICLHAGDHDDRVVPLHSHKLTATLQHVLAGGPDAPQRNPLLTRVEVRAGHGAGGTQKLDLMQCSRPSSLHISCIVICCRSKRALTSPALRHKSLLTGLLHMTPPCCS